MWMGKTEYIKKYGSSREKELKYDFLPKLLEVIERPPNRAGGVIIWVSVSLLIVVIVWACLSKIDVVVTAAGSIQPVGNLNVVQSYTGGVITSIQVSEGAYVEAGDVLIELDTQSLDIDADQLNAQKLILETQQVVYEKIMADGELPADYAAQYDKELQVYVQAIQDEDTNYRNTLASLELEKSNAELNRQIARLQLEEYQRSGTQSQIETQELAVKQYELAKEQADIKQRDTELQYQTQLHTRLAEIDSQIREIESSLAKYGVSKETQQLTAPVSGYINSMEVNTIGATVPSGQNIITILPADTSMEMVCYVKNMDIADIEVGMEAEIKLEAYPYNRFGTVKGRVTYISPSAFMNEQLGSVYLVRLALMETGEGIDIISGLSGSIEIKTGRRTVMDYFMEPIIKGFGESMKEK